MGEGSVKRSYSLVKGAKITPLPAKQVGSMLLLQLCESMQINILFPFLVFMVEDFGYKGEKLGLYAGFLAAAFCAAQFCSAVFWGKVSDRYGRRFALLCGVTGATIAVAVFGFSSSYAHAVAGRAISGLLNGNVGVLKSLLTEVTDETNRAKGFSYMSLSWGIGAIVAPLVGGALCRPAQKFPSTFGHMQLFIDFPYLLPCLVVVAVQLVSTIGTYLYLEDPKPSGGAAQLWADVKSFLLCRKFSSVVPTTPRRKAFRSKRRDGVSYEHVPSHSLSLSSSFSTQLSVSQEYGQFVTVLDEDDMSVGTELGMDELEEGDRHGGRHSTGNGAGRERDWDGGIEMVASCDSIATTANTPAGRSVTHTDPGTGRTTVSSAEFGHESGNDSDCDTVTFDLGSPYDLEEKSPTSSISEEAHEEKPFNMFSDKVVVGAVMNYGALAMAYIIWDETLPMYFKLKTSLGGLSMSSSEIGIALTAGGAAVMLFTMGPLSMLERWKGKFWLMNVGCIVAVPLACFWPVLTDLMLLCGRAAMWVALILFICLKNVLSTMAFTAVTIMVNHSVTDDHLGAVNGFGQSVAAAARAIGPAAGGALWSLSTSCGFVYLNFILAGLSFVACTIITAYLPRTLEHKPGAKHDEEDAEEAPLGIPMH